MVFTLRHPSDLQAEFLTRVVVVREKMMLREQEIHGTWLTEAKMSQKGYSATLDTDACFRFEAYSTCMSWGLLRRI